MTTNDKMIIIEGRSRVSKREEKKEVDIGLNIFYIINCAQKEKRTGSIDTHNNARVSLSLKNIIRFYCTTLKNLLSQQQYQVEFIIERTTQHSHRAAGDVHNFIIIS